VSTITRLSGPPNVRSPDLDDHMRPTHPALGCLRDRLEVVSEPGTLSAAYENGRRVRTRFDFAERLPGILR